MPAKLPITAIILTWNEELHLARALASIQFAERVIVVDSGSTDKTPEIARAAGAELVTRTFVSQANQLQWALGSQAITSSWTLRLDADEVIEPDLAERIAAILPQMDPEVSGICFRRKHIFMGRWVRHGGRYPLVLLRLWRTGRGRVEQRWMDEHIVVDQGKVIDLPGGFADHNLNDAHYFTDKHNRYATREALQVVLERHGLMPADLSAAGAPQQAQTKRWIKEKLYNRLPFGVGPLLYFLWRFFAQLGFLDGREGRIYHVLQGFWYRFLVDVRKLEFEVLLRDAGNHEQKLRRLEQATGYVLAERSSRLPTGVQVLPE